MSLCTQLELDVAHLLSQQRHLTLDQFAWQIESSPVKDNSRPRCISDLSDLSSVSCGSASSPKHWPASAMDCDEDTVVAEAHYTHDMEADSADSDVDTRRRSNCMSEAERKARSRERNRLHARKTRERKKAQMQGLQERILELREESHYLAQLKLKQDAANILLTMSGLPCSGAPTGGGVGGGAVRNWDAEAARHGAELAKTLKQLEELDGCAGREERLSGYWSDETTAITPPGSCGGKQGVARRSKYTAQQRQVIRRERNRMHAKRTRDRKKLVMEATEAVMHKMEVDNGRLRDQLLARGVLPPDYKASIPHYHAEPLPEDLAELWALAQGMSPADPVKPVPAEAAPFAGHAPPEPPTGAGVRYSTRKRKPTKIGSAE